MAKNNKKSSDKFAALRERAEALMAQEGKNSQSLPVEDIRELSHEFFTYQIELELQNEELRQAQLELEQSRRRYVDLYDFAPVGYLTVSDTGMIIEANLTAADMLGEERKVLLHKPLSSFIVEDNQDKYYHHRNKILKTERSQICELQLRSREGLLFYVQMKSVVFTDPVSGDRQFRTTLTDISERKNFEESLCRSKVEWEQTFDAINDIITIQDKDMRIVHANKAAHTAFHARLGELNGKCCYEVFRGVHQPCPNCPERLTLDDCETHSANIINENLQKIYNVTCSPVWDKDRNFTNIVHVAKDITEQKKMEEDLFQSRKMEAIGALAGGIAHDFNNILMAITGFAEIAKLELSEDSNARDNIDNVIQAARRAAELVQQILLFCRKSEHDLQPLIPHLIVEEGLRMLASSLPSTVIIHEDIDKRCGTILADPTNIHQIMMNLCTNALHAMEKETGTLTIKLYSREVTAEEIVHQSGISAGPFVVLAVSDTGHGIDESVKEHIFEPYFTTKEIGKGTGMGLAVIHGIIRDYNGFITVDSTPGEGSTFAVYIPVFEQQTAILEDADVHKTEKKIPLPEGNERILVVDDEPLLVKIYERQLKHFGYTVTGTTDSRNALEKFRAQPEQFDLLITDQTMPRMTGVELARAVMQIRPDLPVILCTGHSAVVTQKETLNLGIKKYIAKPIKKNELIMAIREALDEK